MTLQYQAPQLVQLPDQSGLVNSIDNLFGAYFKGKLQGQQLALGQAQLQAAQQNNAANLAQFRLANGGLSPQDVNTYLPQAMQPQATTLPPGLLPATATAQQPQSLYQPAQPTPMAPQPQAPLQPYQPQQPQGLGQGQPVAEDPKLATVRALLALHQQGQQLGAAQQIAGLNKTQAEAAKAQSDADLNNFFSGGKGGGVGASEWAQNLRADVESGRKAPSQAYTEASRVGPNGLGKFLVDNALAGLPVADLEAKYSAKTSLATGGAIPKANTQSLQSALDVLDSMNQDTPRNSLQLINKLGLAVAAQKGDRVANRLMNQSKLVADMFQNNFGAGSDKKLELAAALSDPSQTGSQLADTIKLVRADMANRIAAFGGQQGTTHPDFGVEKKPGAGKPPPAVGTIDSGYKFIGGNPRNQANWVAVKP